MGLDEAVEGGAGDVQYLLAENDDAVGRQSRVTLDVTAGTVYRLRIAGFSGTSGTARGSIVLNWNLETATPPPTTTTRS